MRAGAVLIAVLTLAVAACGSDSQPRTEEDEVRAVVKDFAAAWVDADWERVCSLFTSEAKADLLKSSVLLGNQGGGCAGALKSLASFTDEAQTDELRNLQIKSVSITGNTAIVRTSGEDGQTQLTKKGDRWLIEAEPESSSGAIDSALAEGRAPAAPAFTLEVLDRGRVPARLRGTLGAALSGARLSLEELRGTPVVLNLWASWCTPCRQEAPRLQRGWERWGPRGVAYLGLNIQDLRGDAVKYARRFGVRHPTIRDARRRVADNYGATGIPETFFVDADGRVVGHVIGVVSERELDAGAQAAMEGRVMGTVTGGRTFDVR
jgi:cytochrome c biogenesis protein CcmG/thiol:disulfide interchange protein DsbE